VMKAWLLQRQRLSVGLQLPKLAFSMQGKEQSGRLWRGITKAEAVERILMTATRANVDRILLEESTGYEERRTSK